MSQQWRANKSSQRIDEVSWEEGCKERRKEGLEQRHRGPREEPVGEGREKP